MSGYTTAPPPGAGGPRPELTGGGLRLAGWWRRVAATLIDGLLIAALTVALVAALAVGASAALPDSGWFLTYALGALIVIACAAVAVIVYAPWMMARTDGRTLGRMVVGIRVVRVDGARMTLGRALLREVVVKWGLFICVGGVLTFGIAPLVDVLWPLWDEQRRALHDFLARTRTVRG